MPIRILDCQGPSPCLALLCCSCLQLLLLASRHCICLPLFLLASRACSCAWVRASSLKCLTFLMSCSSYCSPLCRLAPGCGCGPSAHSPSSRDWPYRHAPPCPWLGWMASNLMLTLLWITQGLSESSKRAASHIHCIPLSALTNEACWATLFIDYSRSGDLTKRPQLVSDSAGEPGMLLGDWVESWPRFCAYIARHLA